MQQETTPIESPRQIMVCTEILSEAKKPKRIHCVKKTADGCLLLFVSCGISSEMEYSYLCETSFRTRFPVLFNMMLDMSLGSMWCLEDTNEGELWTLTDKAGRAVKSKLLPKF